MAFLGNLFKKKEKAVKLKKVKPSISAAEASELLHEEFQPFEWGYGDRYNEICDRFIKSGIVQFKNGSFDETALCELTFDEFCHVYNLINWFVENRAPDLKDSAVLYKKFLRKKLLAKLSTFPVYTLNTQSTALPYVDEDSAFLLYTNRKFAEEAITGHTEWLEIFEITPERFNTLFCELFCTGYKLVNINGETKVKIEDVYETQPIRAYGNICVESCVRMIDYKQTRASLVAKAMEEKRNGLTKDEADHLNQRAYAVSVSLLKNTLLVPAEQKNGKIIVSVPLVQFADGEQFVGLFTDQGAVNRYYKKAVSCVAFPNLIKDQYNRIKNNSTVSGILINPGREEFKLTKSMLKQLIK